MVCACERREGRGRLMYVFEGCLAGLNGSVCECWKR
jgi:hypothetical protein